MISIAHSLKQWNEGEKEDAEITFLKRPDLAHIC